MKKILCFCLLSLLMIGNGLAIDKCVPQDIPIDLEYGEGAGLVANGQPDWVGWNTDTGTEILATSACASIEMVSYLGEPDFGWSEEYAQYGVADNLMLNSLATKNANCFCRILTPVVSKWVSLGYIANGDPGYVYHSSAANCASRCARDCSSYANIQLELFFGDALLSD